MLCLVASAAAFMLPMAGRPPAAARERGGALVMGAEMGTSAGLKTATLTNAAGHSATVYTFGACVTSYVVDGDDKLAVRPDAKLDGSKPISGGIPFCFPQFGPGAIQQHGFARNCEWEVGALTDGDEPSITLTLKDNDYTRGMWDHAFTCEYTVTLAPTALETAFKVTNTGGAPFDFTAALHSYWSVSSISNLKIASPALEGAIYLDKTASPPAKTTQPSAEIAISAETDSVYAGVTGDVRLIDAGKKSTLTISNSEGWEDTVVWNPYGDEGMGYDSFVCVESAKAAEPVTLGAGKSWVGRMAAIPPS